MPRGYTDLEVLTRLRGIMDSRRMTAARAASIMGLERTLVWRAYRGRPVTQANADVIGSRLHLISERQAISTEYLNATNLLHFLLRAVEHYALDLPADPPPTADR